MTGPLLIPLAPKEVHKLRAAYGTWNALGKVGQEGQLLTPSRQQLTGRSDQAKLTERAKLEHGG